MSDHLENPGASVGVPGTEPQFHMERLWVKAYKVIQDDEENAKLLDKVEILLSKGKGSGIQQPYVVLRGEERLRRIQILAKEQLEKLPEARASLTVGEKRIIVRNYVQKAVQTIKQFKPIISGALSAEPHAALAWACILGVLPSLENIFQMDEDAAGGLNKILFMLIRYQHLQESVLSCDSEDLDHTANARQLFSSIEEKLVDIYVKVHIYQLQFLLRYGQGRVSRNLRGIFDPDNWKRQWADIESSKQFVDQAVQDRLAARTAKTWEALGEIEKTAGEILSAVNAMDTRLRAESEKELLRSLKIAENAMFDSAKVQESVESCLQGTQRQILNDVGSWAEDPSGQLIFWLHGMAGTGKSSIALTVANALKNGEPLTEGMAPPATAFLGASFFFKQGDATRNSTEKFFPTIAKGLAEEFGDFMSLVAQVIDENSTIGTKAPQQQLEHLIARPLSIIDKKEVLPMRFIVVVDALDECAKTLEAKDLVSMLSGQLGALHRVQIRFLITSRSEEYIAKSFAQVSEDSYRSARLEKIKPAMESDVVKDDITNYLVYRMRNIAEKHRVKQEDISESMIAQLSKKSDGLFIYAATACRFLNADDFDDEEARQERLNLILQSNADADSSGSENSDNGWTNDAPQNQVDEIYRKVLSYPERGMAPNAKKKTYKCMRMILGFLAVLFEPFAMSSLKEFLPSEVEAVENTLKKLHAIVNVPHDAKLPLELIHLSFRDFILSRKRSRQLKFRVIEIEMHKEVFKRCIEIMTSMLRQDICGLVWPGTIGSEIPHGSVDVKIPPHLRYACRYWVDHLIELDHEAQKDVGLLDHGAIHQFLQKYLLFWLEAMGLIKETATSVLVINKLEILVNHLEYPLLSALVYDMKRFTLSNRWILDHAPLQIYPALIFNPEESPIRSLFKPLIPSWVVQTPTVDTQWTAELCVLQGHTDSVKLVAVSPDKSLIVSLSEDNTTRIWDTITGTERFRFDKPTHCRCLAFSPDGRFIALSSVGEPIIIREFARGIEFLLEDHGNLVKNSIYSSVDHLVYSPKTGTMLASLCWDTIGLWDIESRHIRHVLSYEWNDTCQFTPDERFLLVGGSYTSITMWDVKTGHCVRTFDKLDTTYASELAVSVDGSMATMISISDRLVVFNLSTGEKQAEISEQGRLKLISMMPPAGNSILFESCDKEILIFNAATVSLTTKLRIAPEDSCVSLSRDGDLLVSGGHDHNVRLWDMQLHGPQRHVPKGRLGKPDILQFSPDRSLILSHEYLYKESGRLHGSTGERLDLPSNSVKRICFSPDGELVALWMDHANCQLWRKCMTNQVSIPKPWRDIAFSPSNEYIAVVPTEGGTEIINRTTFQAIMRLQQSAISHMQFSLDGQVFSLVYLDEERRKPVFELWSIPLHKVLWQDRLEYTDWEDYPFEMKFSPSSRFVAYRWHSYNLSRDEPSWCMITLAIEGRKPARVRGHEIVFHTQDHLMALKHDFPIEIKETASLISKRSLKPGGRARTSSTKGSMTFTTTGQLAAVSWYEEFYGTEANVRLWDITSGAQIGRYTVNGHISHLAFSGEGYLLCDQGRLPLPSTVPCGEEKSSSMEQTDATDLLYVGSDWIYYGLSKLMWLPAAFRSEASILAGDTLALAHNSGDVRVIKFELAGLPMRRHGMDRS